MRHLHRFVAVLLLGTFTAGFVASCAKMTTAPITHQEASALSARSAEPNGLIGSVVGAVVNLVYKVLDIVGSIGGSLTNGRWRVDVPPGAIDGNARISLGVVSSLSPSCQLEISPADKNHFNTPVRLTVNCSSVPTDILRTYAIFWYDPATSTWTPVAGSTVDLTKKTVSAPLQHFSAYAVGPSIGGKAGW